MTELNSFLTFIHDDDPVIRLYERRYRFWKVSELTPKGDWMELTYLRYNRFLSSGENILTPIDHIYN